MLAVVLEHMRDRLQAGARDDLLEMAQVAHVKSWTARLLWENGFRNVRALADADAKDILPVLMMVILPMVSPLAVACSILTFYRLDHGKLSLIRTRKKRLSGTPRR